MLYKYAESVQRFLRDSRQQDLDLADIFDHINTARREVAMRAECVVRIPPISGACVAVSVTTAGSGYTSPTVTISGPDFPSGEPPYPLGLQATALPIIQGGSITAIDVQQGGSGYFSPTISVVDPTGSGCEATVTTSPLNLIYVGQEKYPLADIDLSMFPGVEDIISVRSIALLYSNWRYELARYSWSVYNSRIRQFAPSNTYQYVPSFFTQLEQGANGSLYFYPVPSQTYQVEFQCICSVQDLTSDDSYEALPMPWQDAVKYFAAHLCFLDLQSFNNARVYEDQFDKFMHRYGAYARPGFRSNPYGRWIWIVASLGTVADLLFHGLGGVVS